MEDAAATPPSPSSKSVEPLPTTFEGWKLLVPSLGGGNPKENKELFDVVMQFYYDESKIEMSFVDADGTPTLGSYKRKIVHELVVPLGLGHYSSGWKKNRVLHLLKNPRALRQGYYDKDSGAWEPVPEEMKGREWQTENGSLTLVSMNVLMDVPDSKVETYTVHDYIYTQERFPAIYKILESTQAHFIALQEVTSDFHEGLLQQEWVREKYYVSDIVATNFSFMGNLTLSRFPFDKALIRNYSHEFGEPKTTVEGYISSLNGRSLSIYNVHLKAGTPCEKEREREIHENIKIQVEQDYDDSILLGDFNMRDVAQERNLKLEEHYVDLWKHLHGVPQDQQLPEGKEGYTYDLVKNEMSRRVSDIISAIKKTQGYCSRFDRIHLRSKSMRTTVDIQEKEKERDSAAEGTTTTTSTTQHNNNNNHNNMGDWVLKEMRIIADEPIYQSPKGETIFPSDHFGLIAQLQLTP